MNRLSHTIGCVNCLSWIRGTITLHPPPGHGQSTVLDRPRNAYTLWRILYDMMASQPHLHTYLFSLSLSTFRQRLWFKFQPSLDHSAINSMHVGGVCDDATIVTPVVCLLANITFRRARFRRRTPSSVECAASNTSDNSCRICLRRRRVVQLSRRTIRRTTLANVAMSRPPVDPVDPAERQHTHAHTHKHPNTSASL